MIAIKSPWQLGSNLGYILLQTIFGCDAEDPFSSITSMHQANRHLQTCAFQSFQTEP